jgi:hypothetical protein
LISPAFVILRSFPALRQLKILRMKVLMLEQKKVFHIKPNDQNVYGLDISYANNEPPMGEAKAAETPAAAPAAAISLLLTLFLKNLQKEKGI